MSDTVETPVPQQEEKSVRKAVPTASSLRIQSVVLNKAVVSVFVKGAAKTITLLPQGTADLPDTEEVRRQLERYIKSQTIKIV